MTAWILVILLAVTAIILLLKVRRRDRLAADLADALERSTRLLASDRAEGSFTPAWGRLIHAVNDKIEDQCLLELHCTSQIERMKATLTNMQEAVLIVDDSDRVLLANDALRDLFATKGMRDATPSDWIFRNSTLLRHLESVRTGQSPGRQEVELWSEAEAIWLEISGSRIPNFDGEPGEATLLVLHDITRLRKLESVRKEFVANVSHELRTPLSLIKGYVETLKDGGESIPAEDRSRFLQIIDKHTSRLERLVEDLLSLSRLEGGNPRLRREGLYIESIIEELVNSYRQSHTDQRVSFIMDLEENPALIQGDALRLAQVIGNLMENAIKYSGGKEVKVTAGTRCRGDQVDVWIADNGVGIDAEHLPHIFERFYRVDKGRSRENGGTGLGLSIVKHIVQLHGGQVWAESTPGQGTAIRFSVPTMLESPAAVGE